MGNIFVFAMYKLFGMNEELTTLLFFTLFGVYLKFLDTRIIANEMIEYETVLLRQTTLFHVKKCKSNKIRMRFSVWNTFFS